MDIVAQILTERPGDPEHKEFDVADLQDVVEGTTSERKHITLYPADYTSEWGSTPDIEIPENVTITLMPGAIVNYAGDYRVQEYSYDGDPIDSDTHPLGDSGSADRYDAPSFTGHVENITDLNLASEWAFKQEFERSLWNVRNQETTEIFEIPFDGVVEFRPENKIEIATDDLPGTDEGSYVAVNHMSIPTAGSPDNSGTSDVIQSLAVDDGHVQDVEVLTVVERIENTDGYITLSSNQEEITIGHADTGIVAPDVPDGSSIRDFETDDRGHIELVEYGANVEEVQGGLVLNVTGLSAGTFEVSHDEIDISGSPQNSGATVIQSVNPYTPPSNLETGHIDNVDAVDIVGGSGVDVSSSSGSIEIANGAYQFTGEPADPAQGEAVKWFSNGTGTGDQGDFMVKINVGGTVKTTTLVDYSAV